MIAFEVGSVFSNRNCSSNSSPENSIDLSFVKKLKMQSPQDTLRLLVHQVENAVAPDAVYPHVTVTMGGFSFAGIPVRVDSVRNDNILILVSPDRGSRGQDALVYLPMNAITSVTVESFQLHLNVLTTGVAPAGIGEAPSRLALERKVSEVSSKIGMKISFLNLEPEANEAVRTYFDRLLESTEIVLSQVKGDSLGRESIGELVDIQLGFSESDKLNLKKEGSSLKIVIGYSQSLKQLNADLLSQIEKAL